LITTVTHVDVFNYVNSSKTNTTNFWCNYNRCW